MTVFERLKEDYNFYHYRDNWHKIPIISKLMCFAGRHDFEAYEVNVDGKTSNVRLNCFYCWHEKTVLGVKVKE
jgi:hypothetical protein